ncbi:ABC transporter substrate-binding protein [Massilia sp. TS11]|uniref:substrate-binding periplasmic protein n=1 Tax=Massilia sp. TS11 TaxID=2908003 RepID=UPI001EDA9AF9|nr:transporter substrate-binding domain-containing protein [Massilia sp. TS11]MCG2585350.1 transporter substrate-binding domain-containing protein [Massilia sp. TS11]
MRFSFAILAALLCLPAARAADPPCGDMSVGLYESGLLYYQHDGRWKGINKDLLDELSKRTGCNFKTALDSRVRIWAALEAGNLDMTVTALRTPEREKFVRIIPYVSSHNYVMVLKGMPPETQTPEGFLNSELRVGVVKAFRHGPFYDAWLEQMRARGRVYEAADLPGLVKLMRNQRVHAIIGPAGNWTYMRDMHLEGQVNLLNWAGEERLLAGLAVSRKRVPEADYQRMAQAIAQMHADGTLERIYRRYVNAEMARDMITF